MANDNSGKKPVNVDRSEPDLSKQNRMSYASAASAAVKLKDDQEWQLQVSRRRRMNYSHDGTSNLGPVDSRPAGMIAKGSAVIGKARNVTIKAAKPKLRLANVFVTRLDPQLTEGDLKSYLVTNLKLDNITVELVKSTEFHTSFHVKCECVSPSVFLNDNLWPDGAYVRWWQDKKENTDSNGLLLSVNFLHEEILVITDQNVGTGMTVQIKIKVPLTWRI